MSRIGIKPVEIPKGVKASQAGGVVEIEGPKGRVRTCVHPDIQVKIAPEKLTVHRPSDSRLHRSLHGMVRAILRNAVQGVTQGYSRNLTVNGVGYSAKVQGKDLVLVLGFSHPIKLPVPEGLKVVCPAPTAIEVTGADRQQVGQFAAIIRAQKPPEPYNLKGIKYSDEVIKKKAGKTFVSGA